MKRLESQNIKPVFPPVVDLNVNGRCNLNCNYCYGPPKDSPELDFNDIIKVLKTLKNGGTSSIAITGGEPLLRDDIIDIFINIKKLGFNTALHTNGILLEEKHEIINYIDWLCLPLDGSNSQVVRSIRNSDTNFEAVISILDKIKNNGFKKPKHIKIGTVVTKYNINDLKNIAKILVKYNIDVWKCHEVRPRGMGNKYFKNIHIPEIEINRELNEIMDSIKDSKIFFSSIYQSIGAYFFVYPDGSVLIPFLNGYKNFGSIFKLNDDFNALELIDENSYNNNVNGAYLDTFSTRNDNKHALQQRTKVKTK